MTYSTTEKTDILNELIVMAHADHHLKLVEIEFIKAVGKRLGMEATDVDQLLDNPDLKPSRPPKEFTKRIIHFHRLMLMMHIDGMVDDSELQLLHEIALRYGIRRLTVLTLLDMMKKYPHGEIPPSELLAIHSQPNN